LVTKLTAKEIRSKVMETVLHTAPELMSDIPGKLIGYVDLLEGKLERCCDSTGEVVRCQECLETGKVLEDVVNCIRSMEL
jgi:hypothetical protein